MLLSVVAAVCLCVPVYGLAGTEQKSNEFLFLLGEINQLREKVHTLETQLQKDVNVHLDLSESQHCENGEHHFEGGFNKHTIRFSKPFSTTPVINYGMVALDSSHSTNVRVNCVISDITLEKFDMKCGPWDNTVMYGVRISWMAC